MIFEIYFCQVLLHVDCEPSLSSACFKNRIIKFGRILLKVSYQAPTAWLPQDTSKFKHSLPVRTVYNNAN